jgi:hypothetical protein
VKLAITDFLEDISYSVEDTFVSARGEEKAVYFGGEGA